MRRLIFVALVALMPWGASAAPQTVQLEVANMTCGLCPLTVKKSLEKVPGVTQVRVDYAQKTATVSYDDSRTGTAALVKATTDAGFPSTVRP